jgi:hypothetical protein
VVELPGGRLEQNARGGRTGFGMSRGCGRGRDR